MPSTVKNQICSKIITNYFLFLTSYCHLTRTVSQRPFRILNFLPVLMSLWFCLLIWFVWMINW